MRRLGLILLDRFIYFFGNYGHPSCKRPRGVSNKFPRYGHTFKLEKNQTQNLIKKVFQFFFSKEIMNNKEILNYTKYNYEYITNYLVM